MTGYTEQWVRGGAEWQPFSTQYRSEQELASAVLAELSRWFEIVREVPGTHCSGKRLRIDALLRPIDRTGWGEAPVLGIEFKHLEEPNDLGKLGLLAAQAVDYAHTAWDGYGRTTVFTCPPISGTRARFPDERPAFVQNLLGRLGVGEFGWTVNYGWLFRLFGENIWSERRGAHGKWDLKRHVGSR